MTSSYQVHYMDGLWIKALKVVRLHKLSIFIHKYYSITIM
jgi:hypothetical protein